MVDKELLFEQRGYECECQCGQPAHDAHHALIGRRKGYPELDCEENIILVNHSEHIARKFDNRKWREIFWKRQCDRYGKEHMLRWVDSLPAKIRPRLNWIKILEKEG